MKVLAGVLLLPTVLVGVAGWAWRDQELRDRVYVGEKVCRECHHLSGHRDQFNSWRLSKHAQGYATLSMPEAAGIAEGARLLRDSQFRRQA